MQLRFFASTLLDDGHSFEWNCSFFFTVSSMVGVEVFVFHLG